MIPMPVREQDRFGPRPGAKPRLGRFENLVGPAGETGIHQDPSATRPSEEINVNETDRQPADIRCDARDDSHFGQVECYIVNR